MGCAQSVPRTITEPEVVQPPQKGLPLSDKGEEESSSPNCTPRLCLHFKQYQDPSVFDKHCLDHCWCMLSIKNTCLTWSTKGYFCAIFACQAETWESISILSSLTFASPYVSSYWFAKALQDLSIFQSCQFCHSCAMSLVYSHAWHD